MIIYKYLSYEKAMRKFKRCPYHRYVKYIWNLFCNEGN